MTEAGLGLGLGLGYYSHQADYVPFETPTMIRWLAAVAAAGGTVSNATKDAARAFAIAVETLGITDANARINLHAGDQLAAANVPIFRGGAADTDAVLGSAPSYAESAGMSSNGTTQAIDARAVASAFGFMYTYLRVAPTGSGISIMGVRDASSTQIYRIQRAAGPSFRSASYGGGVPITHLADTTPGGYGVQRVSNTDLRLHANGTQVNLASTSVTATAVAGRPVYLFGQNGDGTIGLRSNPTIAGYAYATAGITVDQAALHTAFQTFNAALGRNV
jgi:hypothetical protein